MWMLIVQVAYYYYYLICIHIICYVIRYVIRFKSAETWSRCTFKCTRSLDIKQDKWYSTYFKKTLKILVRKHCKFGNIIKIKNFSCKELETCKPERKKKVGNIERRLSCFTSNLSYIFLWENKNRFYSLSANVQNPGDVGDKQGFVVRRRECGRDEEKQIIFQRHLNERWLPLKVSKILKNDNQAVQNRRDAEL